ncbi:MAG: lactonase family protein [Lachnospiraceae bacterium]|jgi:6-phosphogluconolactonase (cycloisomerase 2 family)|nr:lactonase family protein [Lachnospiraceae bacterium]
MTIRFYVGSYAEKSEPGVALCELDGERKHILILARYAGVKNPIYFARHPKKPMALVKKRVDKRSPSMRPLIPHFELELGTLLSVLCCIM